MTSQDHELIPDQPGTIAKGGGRKWIFPVEIRGRWQSLRLVSSALLLMLLYATPWLTINGAPFLRLSFLSSSFVMFGSHILIYEFYHFVLLALLLVLTLFVASALIGRVWCGFACPQTVFIEQILGRVDRLFEGSAAKRKLDSNRPWTLNRVLRRIGKLLAYLVISLSFSFTLVALFTGPDLILVTRHPTALWIVGILTALAMFDAAYWREQFCHIACPYARFQGVMQDMATRTIGYDHVRGEPRGRPAKSTSADESSTSKKGDCIDCGLCVRVCPSGIDIRQGATQLECVACARCVDACDGVMKNIGREPGLIRYDALGKFEFESPATVAPPILRPRVVIYGLAWLLLLSIGIQQFVNRSPFHARVFGTSGANPWFVEGDRIKNLLSLKVGNQSSGDDVFTVTVEATDATSQMHIETPTQLGPIAPGQEWTMPLLISVMKGPTKGLKEIIRVRSKMTGEERLIERKFVGPDL